MRVVFADGSEQIVRSGEGEWEALPPKSNPSPAQVVCRYGEKPLGEAVVFPRKQLAPVWMRTSVSVEPGLRRARLYISSLGFGDATINGQPVSDAVLTPAQTDYGSHAMVDIHDVTTLLRPGDNALAVFLDPGWYDQVGGFGQIMSYGRPRLKALLRLDYDDGHSTVRHQRSVMAVEGERTALGESLSRRANGLPSGAGRMEATRGRK